MSILDFPRVHFKGVARVNVPTGNRNVKGTLDIATNTVYQDGVPFDYNQHPTRYHEYLKGLSPKFNQLGEPDDTGSFNKAAGYNMMGNNHFSWENTAITAVQLEPGKPIHNDPLVGCKVALWGHYNEYLRTSFNRARWVDNDPTRRDTAQIYAGQVTISEANADPSQGCIISADIDCTHSVRFMNNQYILDDINHFLADEMAEARLFQFSVLKNDNTFSLDHLALDSDVLNYLNKRLKEPHVLGLTIQYSVSNMSPPIAPDMPVFCDLHGSISLWCEDDMATVPSGRILYPDNTVNYAPIMIKPSDNWLHINMPITIPHSRRKQSVPVENGLPPKLDSKKALGDLYVKTHAGDLVAIISQIDYQQSQSGVFDVELLRRDIKLETVSLYIESAEQTWTEHDWHIQAEQNVTAIESYHPDVQGLHLQRVKIRSYFRGIPTSIHGLKPHIITPNIFRCEIQVSTQENGWGELVLESLAAGSGELTLANGKGRVQVRVLSDDWALLDIPDNEVDFTFLFKNVMGYYELLYPFMADKVFSMADKCKCETYARLMWQMCDPRNRDKSYYMPSTREMSTAKSHLFLKYLRNVEQSSIPRELPPLKPDINIMGSIKSKTQLIAALKDAVDLELSIMLQYLYSAYSLPNYAAGEQYVKAGRWSLDQLELVNGGEDRRHNSGWRGALLEIAHEEMIHYLAVNNLLMSLGEPFYPGQPVFGADAKAKFGLDTEFSFEPFSEHVIAKFVRFEWPQFFPSVGRSIADAYDAIRVAFEEIPDLYTDSPEKSGGEHHLFLNEIVNRSHPGYQFEVYNRETALFAIDFVTEQGEGVSADSAQFELSHFNRLRSISKALTQSDIPFEPAMPVLKNPVFIAREGCNLVTDPQAVGLMKLYKGCHELMFHMMMQHFAQKPLASMRRSRMMNAAIDLMTGILRPLSVYLMSIPSGVPGRNAGPPIPETIKYKAPEDFSEGCFALSRQCEQLVEMATKIELERIPETQIELLTFYKNQMFDLATGKLSKEG